LEKSSQNVFFGFAKMFSSLKDDPFEGLPKPNIQYAMLWSGKDHQPNK
jgi:hypothetical protein